MGSFRDEDIIQTVHDHIRGSVIGAGEGDGFHINPRVGIFRHAVIALVRHPDVAVAVDAGGEGCSKGPGSAIAESKQVSVSGSGSRSDGPGITSLRRVIHGIDRRSSAVHRHANGIVRAKLGGSKTRQVRTRRIKHDDPVIQRVRYVEILGRGVQRDVARFVKSIPAIKGGNRRGRTHTRRSPFRQAISARVRHPKVPAADGDYSDGAVHRPRAPDRYEGAVIRGQRQGHRRAVRGSICGRTGQGRRTRDGHGEGGRAGIRRAARGCKGRSEECRGRSGGKGLSRSSGGGFRRWGGERIGNGRGAGRSEECGGRSEGKGLSRGSGGGFRRQGGERVANNRCAGKSGADGRNPGAGG